MGLLSSELEYALPRLRSQDDEVEPMVFAHYLIPDHPWAYYVTEGQRHGDEYRFYGFLMVGSNDDDWRWSHEHLSGLERLMQGRVIRKHSFRPGRLTDVVVLPL